MLKLLIWMGIGLIMEMLAGGAIALLCAFNDVDYMVVDRRVMLAMYYDYKYVRCMTALCNRHTKLRYVLAVFAHVVAFIIWPVHLLWIFRYYWRTYRDEAYKAKLRKRVTAMMNDMEGS